MERVNQMIQDLASNFDVGKGADKGKDDSANEVELDSDNNEVELDD
jgi:hypothetical protein